MVNREEGYPTDPFGRPHGYDPEQAYIEDSYRYAEEGSGPKHSDNAPKREDYYYGSVRDRKMAEQAYRTNHGGR